MRRQHATAEYLLRTAGIKQPPVDVRTLAEAMDIRVREANIPDTGILETGPRGAVIIVRANDPPMRKRFTIAHEIGHLMHPDHQLGREYRERAFNGGPREITANAYAADLLMPMWMLDVYAMGLSVDPKRLAKIFEVSEDAMRVRLMRWAGAR